MANPVSIGIGKTRWVTKAGNDGNSGDYDAPLLTIAFAVSASADGDNIVIGAGTFSESVNAAGRALHFEGVSASLCIVTTSGVAPVLRVGSYSSVKNLTLTSTYASGTGLHMTTGVRDVEVRGCVVTGPFDGLFCPSTFNIRLYDSEFYSTYDGANIAGCRGAVVENCYFHTDCTYSPDAEFRALVADGDSFSGVIRNSRCRAERTGTAVSATIAISAGRDTRIENVSLESYVSGGTAVSEALCLSTFTSSGTSGAVMLRGVHFDATNAGSGGTVHARTLNCTVYDFGSSIDSTKVVGSLVRQSVAGGTETITQTGSETITQS